MRFINRPIIVLQSFYSETIGLEVVSGSYFPKPVVNPFPKVWRNSRLLRFNLSEENTAMPVVNLINGGFVCRQREQFCNFFPATYQLLMMACPDREVEGRVMKALNEVKSFGKLAGGGIGFYDADNTLVMVLVKK